MSESFINIESGLGVGKEWAGAGLAEALSWCKVGASEGEEGCRGRRTLVFS